MDMVSDAMTLQYAATICDDSRGKGCMPLMPQVQ